MYFNFVDPISQLGGLVRIGNRPGLGYSETSVQLTLPGGGRSRSVRDGSSGRTTTISAVGRGLDIVITEPTRKAEIT